MGIASLRSFSSYPFPLEQVVLARVEFDFALVEAVVRAAARVLLVGASKDV